jgi:murein DD-endopeptidase MepM/ murein hydrolase activator NlpD
MRGSIAALSAIGWRGACGLEDGELKAEDGRFAVRVDAGDAGDAARSDLPNRSTRSLSPSVPPSYPASRPPAAMTGQKAGPPLRRRPLILIALAALVLLAACGGGDASGEPTVVTTPEPSPTAAPDLSIFRGYSFPIEGACLPESDLLMPNAPRNYRSGVHEGVDFYAVDNCVTIETDTRALAVKDGTVIRADHGYHDLTPDELASANATIAAGDPHAFEVLDLFRGRQVWIDHGHGIVTRYAHLGGIPPEVQVGVRVRRGDVVGYIGDSGTPESISSPDTEVHLHWEFRVGDSFLGEGLAPEDVRAIYEALFTPLPP